MPRRDSGPAAEQRLFLAHAPERGRAELHPDDLDHALRVLRLEAGDEVIGLDGAGRAWRMRVASVERRAVVLAGAEVAAEAPRPGSGGGAPPAVKLCVALPKPAPAEEMFDRLVQLGLDTLVPLIAERSGPHARELSPHRRERLERIAREALKQSGRLWLPRIAAPEGLGEVLGRGLPQETAFLDPGASASFLEWSSKAVEAHEPALFVGPEGGWTDAEREALVRAGATPCRLARAILRIETAAEAALAVLAAVDV
ncbi:MAG: 16S rRNA (uracil(1498)-N(3))-methyltransferase [Planctomycetes bacterium]|nr:16S rRNA (uracil(1498)-N(3))-methyltransferase [Planctomycetota bacterium]